MTSTEQDHSHDARARLADEVSVRRAVLGRTQEQLSSLGGPSSRAVRDIESARMENITPGTLAKLDRGLDWPDGTAARILAGTATKTEVSEVVRRGAATAALGLVATATGQANPTSGDDDGDAIFTLGSQLVPLLARRAASTPASLAALNSLLHLMSEIAEGMGDVERTDG